MKPGSILKVHRSERGPYTIGDAKKESTNYREVRLFFDVKAAPCTVISVAEYGFIDT
jgi:hypothetical protein